MANRLVRLGVFASLALPAPARAQADSGVPIPRALSYHFASRVLGESRVIDVALPAGYEHLVVLKGKIQPDGTLLVAREPRGWVPRGPGSELRRTERFRKDGNKHN
jgi:hypothetical protein